MRFIVTGIGSIGQRHYKNLTALGHRVAVFRARGLNSPFIEAFLDAEAKKGKEVVTFRDLDQAIAAWKPDAVFVTNPNSMHMETALKVARKGVDLFIEKPVSNTLSGFAELERLVKKHRLVAMVGYNVRFHPLLRKMKTLYESGAVGSAIAVHAENGESIEDWHPWEDYRKAYAAYKKGGGGAILCFSHDVDYLYWFFGKPKVLCASGGKITPLGGDAEDMVRTLLQFKGIPIASLHLDYWRRPPRRFFEIVGTKGTLIWDYYGKELKHIPHEKGAESFTWSLPGDWDKNGMFLEEAKAFIKSLKKRSAPPITLRQGREVVGVSLDIKKKIGF